MEQWIKDEKGQSESVSVISSIESSLSKVLGITSECFFTTREVDGRPDDGEEHSGGRHGGAVGGVVSQLRGHPHSQESRQEQGEIQVSQQHLSLGNIYQTFIISLFLILLMFLFLLLYY